jgi:signal transduction histidine kinase/DNA-binding response OmpR family regulator
LAFALFDISVRHEQDVVTARQRAGQLAGLLGFDQIEQTRIATAVSEIVRNAFRYAGSGRVEYAVEGETAPQLFSVVVSDQGTGIRNVDEVMSGRYRSTTGMGIGLLSARRLVDRFQLESTTQGTTVRVKRFLPRRAPLVDSRKAGEIARAVSDRRPLNLVEEFQRQNQELLRALDELNRRQEDLVRLNRELEDTNRGVVALYAELDEKADHLRRADELKSRFLSNMTHEFRTPVNSILALTSLLEDRQDPPSEVKYLRKAAENLSELVNDLLDLAKVEAGKTEVRAADFEVVDLYGALRGMLRPLLVNQSVSLVFDEPEGLPTMRTDEGKVSQILRNFISNALKYTERGHVRVSAHLAHEAEAIVFAVEDTGIGIAPEDQQRIFNEFAQVEHPLQRRFKGTGLGLPLSKRLTELLGGRLWVESEPGVGSRFFAEIPIQYRNAPTESDQVIASWTVDPARIPILVVEDAFEDQLFYEKILKNTPFQLLAARTLPAARQALSRIRPAAVILDILLQNEQSWTFLCQIKETAATADIPVLVVSTVDDRAKSAALGADQHAVKPIERAWLLRTLECLTTSGTTRVLLVDDQDVMRSVIAQFLDPRSYTVIEAETGAAGLAAARTERPGLILLDLGLPDMNGRQVLAELKADPDTRSIPVVLVTSARLESAERVSLDPLIAGILPKEALTRETVNAAARRALAAPDAGRAAAPDQSRSHG